MATATPSSVVETIGVIAGEIWHRLDEKGSLSMSALCKEIDAPRDTIMQALGWLAREDKVEIEETSRGRQVSLR